ncbi:MAG: CobW family GTP-binding protein [Cyanobacteriota bacterium]
MSNGSEKGAPLASLRGVPATVVGGYLGSGKTTLINGWLQEADHQGWALLVNDLGSINIDAERLRQTDGRVLELGGGCVCCTLRDGLGAALLELARREQPPAHVLIETSGMAIPQRVASQVQLHGLAVARVLLVVDMERIEALWSDPWVGELVQQQFDGVDLLQFCKGDLLATGHAEQRQHWLRQQLEMRQQQSTPPFHNERQLVRSDPWLQLEPLERSRVLAWAAQLGPEVLRAKGELWLADAPDGPVPFDRVGDRVTLAAAPSHPWRKPLQRRGQLVAISRATASAPQWPATVPTTCLIPA